MLISEGDLQMIKEGYFCVRMIVFHYKLARHLDEQHKKECSMPLVSIKRTCKVKFRHSDCRF